MAINADVAIGEAEAKREEAEIFAQVGVTGNVLHDLLLVNHRPVKPRRIAPGKNLSGERERRRIIAPDRRSQIGHSDSRKRRANANMKVIRYAASGMTQRKGTDARLSSM